MNLLKICEECNKPTIALVPPSKPSTGEFYCEDCRKSYPMTQAGEPEYWMAARKV